MDTPKKWVRVTLGILQVFVGVGAVPFGLMLMLDPSGSLVGLPLEGLRGSPFPDYLIPGIFLFTVNGVGSLIGAFLTFRRHDYASLVAIGLGAFLIVWIMIQVWSLGSPIAWLQVLYFVVGVVELALGWLVNPAAVRSILQRS